MKRLLLLFWLQAKSLAKPSVLIAFVLLAPLLLGLIAGYGNKMNYDLDVKVAIVDADRSEQSKELKDALASRGWTLHDTDAKTADSLLAMGGVGAIIRIGDGFDAFTARGRDDADIHFEQTDQSLMQVTIRQSVLLYAETRRTLSQLESNVISYRNRHQEDATQVADEMKALIDYYRENEGAMPIAYANRPEGNLRRAIVVGDFTLEIFYLAVLAVIAATTLAWQPKRLLAVPFAVTLSILQAFAVWLILGLGQIGVYLAAMSSAMASRDVFAMFFPLFAYFALMLALAFWLLHISNDIGLYLGLFVVFLLSLAGGVFFPLPGPLLTGVARYTPLGWIYAYQANMADLPVWSIWLAAGLLLAALIASFVRPKRRRL